MIAPVVDCPDLMVSDMTQEIGFVQVCISLASLCSFVCMCVFVYLCLLRPVVLMLLSMFRQSKMERAQTMIDIHLGPFFNL